MRDLRVERGFHRRRPGRASHRACGRCTSMTRLVVHDPALRRARGPAADSGSPAPQAAGRTRPGRLDDRHAPRRPRPALAVPATPRRRTHRRSRAGTGRSRTGGRVPTASTPSALIEAARRGARRRHHADGRRGLTPTTDVRRSLGSAAELGGVVGGHDGGAGIDERLHRLAAAPTFHRVSMPSSPILAGNWATDASSAPGDDERDLVGQRVEADEDDVLGRDARIGDRRDGTDGRRAAGGVDRGHVGVAGQDVLGRRLALVLGAARRQLA